ncbi:ABC transporter permease subunit [Clostridium sp. BJN0001]|uniref:ABC transporter permease subunit n=1 Tax=Clostridium sp. BJN0001 TaxID=2930219 RepID=UPI001FD24740|nr:ABC transporter permease subunit [Clostridium sp. BJN0001]
MNIFKREIYKNRKSFIVWTIILLVLSLYVVALFPTMADQADRMKDVFKSMPKAFLDAFNVNKLDMGTILGFFGMEGYLFITLLGSMYSILLGAGIISKEEDEKTIEFLLSKPISRNNILVSKMAATFIYIILFNLIIVIFNYFEFEAVKRGNFDKETFLLLSVAPLLIHITFASIGFLMSMFIVRAKSVLPTSIGIVLGTYFLGIISAMTDKTENLKYISPFKYVDAADIILNKKIDSIYLLIMAIIVFSCIGATYVIYNKKDIRI